MTIPELKLNNKYVCHFYRMIDTFIVESQDKLAEIADILLKKYPSQRVFTLQGVMGAGKTTFMKYICKSLKSNDLVTSPSFSIVSEYMAGEGSPIYHFDFYRIKNVEEAIQIGFDEFLLSGSYCFIEWSEKVERLLPEGTVNVEIKLSEEQNQKIRIIRF